MSRQQHIHELFDQGVALPQSQRADFMRRSCGDDEALRAEVEALLRAHEAAGEFLRDPTVPPRLLTESGHLSVGSEVGAYKLLRVLGEGGYGVVYEAEQNQPLHRTVALKVIKAGMDSRQVIARFELERQALAMMDHPGIARVLDAGATPSGRPYFVMELVDGPPITDYCRSKGLDLKQRLDLFSAVCRAVQHAHQKGILHRDLKPGNVLVGMHDGKPVAKVIDFGIAKALHPQVNGQTITIGPQLLGTPQYMSPEQASGSPADLDTRSDIYSLGVLLYELLTDTPPFDPATLRSAAYAQVQRIIRETDPPPPSSRLATQTPSGDSSEHRGEARRRRDLVRGDLDWIVMKAMEKDRARRYGTAEALADDVRRHLGNEPVSAGSPTKLYLLQKFARRHRGPLATAGVVLAALVLGLSAAVWGAVRAHRSAAAQALLRRAADEQRLIAETNAKKARDQADRLLATQREFYHLLSFQAEDGSTAPPQVLDFISARADGGTMPEHPEAEAPVRTALGMAYLRQGRWADAEKQLRRGLELQRRLTGPETPDVASYLNYIGECLIYQKKYDTAVPLLRESLRIYAARGFHVIAPCAVKSNLAAAFAAQGKLAETEAVIRDALATAKGTPYAVQYDPLEGIRDLAGSLEERGDAKAAAALLSMIKTLRDRLGAALDRPVRPAADGALLLTSATADLHGISIRIQPDASIGHWASRDEAVLWTLAPDAPGLYQLGIQYGCDNLSAGSDFVVEVAGQTLAAVVQPRDAGQQYAVSTLGTVRLPAGTAKLLIRPSPGGTFRGPLMNLRALQLTPRPPSTGDSN